MTPGEEITIRKCANGWQVWPATLKDEAVFLGSVHVFNKMGYSSSDGDGMETLLEFIERHFREPKP